MQWKCVIFTIQPSFFYELSFNVVFIVENFPAFFLWHRQIKMSELLIIMVENLTFFLNLCTAISINDDYIGVAPVNVYCLHFTSNKILLLLAFFYNLFYFIWVCIFMDAFSAIGFLAKKESRN